MTCAPYSADLIAFEFNGLEDPARASLEAHLGECSACVKEHLALKRQLERADVAPAVRPSRAAAQRLRGAVAQQLSPAPPAWVRPVSWAVASAAALAAMLFVGAYARYEAVPSVLVSRLAH